MPSSLVVLNADVTTPAASTWADVTGLSFAVSAGVQYLFEFSLLVVAGATTTGHILGVNGPASPTYLRYTWMVNSSLSALTMNGSNIYDHAVVTPTTSGSQTATAPLPSMLKGVIVPSINGTLICRLRPEVAATVTVQRGSYGVLTS